jgi:Na+/H+ antiporter NhaD/arsenite permease-like protein
VPVRLIDLQGAVAIAILVATYALFILRERQRLLFAGIAAGLVLVLGLVPLNALLPTDSSGHGSVIEWDTLALLAGLFALGALLKELGVFRTLATDLTRRTHGNPLRLYLTLALLAAILAAFVDSISVPVILAAMTIEIARTLKRNPIPFLMVEIFGANIGGAATLVGDPPNVILGTHFDMTFLDFLTHTGVAAVAAFALVLVLMWPRVRGDVPTGPPSELTAEKLPDPRRAHVAIIAFVAVIALLIGKDALGIPVWVVGLVGFAVAFAVAGPKYGPALARRFDGRTLLFFFFLFIFVGSLTTTGVIESFAGTIGALGGGNLLLTGTILLLSLGLLSMFIDNVPLAAAAAPMIASISATYGLPVEPLVYATTLGCDFGGNGSPIGASANIVGLSIAKQSGVTIAFTTWVRQAFPIMLATLVVANVVWIFVH